LKYFFKFYSFYRIPHPLKIPILAAWGEYGYFLEQHNVSWSKEDKHFLPLFLGYHGILTFTFNFVFLALGYGVPYFVAEFEIKRIPWLGLPLIIL